MINITLIKINQVNKYLNMELKLLEEKAPTPTFPIPEFAHSFLYIEIPPNNESNISISNILADAKLSILFKKFTNCTIL